MRPFGSGPQFFYSRLGPRPIFSAEGKRKELLGAKTPPFSTGAIAQILMPAYFHYNWLAANGALASGSGNGLYLGGHPAGVPWDFD